MEQLVRKTVLIVLPTIGKTIPRVSVFWIYQMFTAVENGSYFLNDQGMLIYVFDAGNEANARQQLLQQQQTDDIQFVEARRQIDYSCVPNTFDATMKRAIRMEDVLDSIPLPAY